MAETTFSDEPLELTFEVSEMVSEIGQVVRLDQSRVSTLLEDYGDDKPQFPILRVESGQSGNGNNWPESLLVDIAEQINREEKPGYWGHIKPDERGYVFPDPETLWLGATVKNESGKKVLYVKGYNIPGGRARRHRSLAKVTSWAGRGGGKFVNGVRQMERFVLESIDWARPGSAGMNARVVSWATEMEGSDKEVDWSKVTLDEIERENPSLFTLMEQRAASKTQAVVTEMEKKVEKGEEAQSLVDKLYAALGLKPEDDVDPIEKVATLVSEVEKVGTAEVRQRIKAVLSKKFKNEGTLKVLDRLVPVTEMSGANDDDLEKKIDEWLSTDDDAKAIVTEMEQAPAPLTRSARGNGNESDKIGQSGMVSVKPRKL